MSESVITQNNSLDDNLSATEPTVEPNENDIKDNGDAQEEDTSPAKKIKLSNDVNAEAPVPAARAGRPSKASTAKRLNILEKTAKEGEALLQNMGHKSDDNPESTRRTTRSQTRGTPAPTPTPPKKERATPKSTPSKDNTPNSGTPKRRGRPPKSSVNNSVEGKTEVNTNSEEKTEKSESTEETDESQEKTVNNTNNSNETNNKTTKDAKTSESAEKPKDAIDGKASKGEKAAIEQTNDLSAKTNSISDDTSKSVPVLDTQQPTPE